MSCVVTKKALREKNRDKEIAPARSPHPLCSNVSKRSVIGRVLIDRYRTRTARCMNIEECVEGRRGTRYRNGKEKAEVVW